jgi:hypothetical protein
MNIGDILIWEATNRLLAAVQHGRPPSLSDYTKTLGWKPEDNYFNPYTGRAD